MEKLADKIQDSELEVMHILWRRNEAVPLIDLRRELKEKCDWEDSTVKTLLRRLCEKGAVELESRGMYRAIIPEEEYNRFSVRRYINKVFEGSAKKLVASLVSDKQLDENDIAELYEMFNKVNKDG